MTDKQTMTDDGQKGGSEDSSQESVAALVRQYEQETGDQSPVLKALQPVVDFAKTEMSARQQRDIDDSIDGAYKFVTEEESLKGLKKPLVRGLLEAYGIENPGFMKAFANQKQDPQAWKSALSEGRDWVKGQYEELVGGKGLREDLEAAKAAVAGTSTEAVEEDKPNPAKLFAMSDADFQNTMQEAIAKAAK